MKRGIGKLAIILLLALLIMGITGCQAQNRSAATSEPAATVPLAVVHDDGMAVIANPDGGDAQDADSAGRETAGQTTGSGTGETEQDPDSNRTERVSLLITRDFGRQGLMQKNVSLPARATVLDLLQANAEVAAKWEGSFINSINGLKSDSGGLSGKRTDWFFFINGICSDVGAAEYSLRSGETVWWDYHLWGDIGPINAAVIGCYPEPFIHGYRGQVYATTLMSSANYQDLAAMLRSALQMQGVKSVQSSQLSNEMLQNRTGPVIVLGTWDELKQLPWLESLNKSYRKIGISVHFTDSGVELLDGRNNVVRESGPNTGIIASTASGLGDARVLWLLVGTDAEGLKSAVDLLVNRPAQIQGFYQAAVISGSAVRLPLQ